VRELVTAAGTPAVLYDYDPYGNPVTLTAEKACLESLLNDCKCKADAQAALGGNASNINYYCNTKPPFP
jgi:hypothetical protein